MLRTPSLTCPTISRCWMENMRISLFNGTSKSAWHFTWRCCWIFSHLYSQNGYSKCQQNSSGGETEDMGKTSRRPTNFYKRIMKNCTQERICQLMSATQRSWAASLWPCSSLLACHPFTSLASLRCSSSTGSINTCVSILISLTSSYSASHVPSTSQIWARNEWESEGTHAVRGSHASPDRFPHVHLHADILWLTDLIRPGHHGKSKGLIDCR